MKPIINLEDPVGKIVGQRRAPADALNYALGLNKMLGQLGRSLGHKPMPKGVYRFRTHEEADEWLMKYYIRRAKS